MKRGLGQLGDLLILLLVGVIFISGFTIFYGGLASDYTTSSYSNASNVSGAVQAYRDLNATSAEIGVAIQSSTTSDTNPAMVFFNGAFSALKLVFGVVNIAQDFLGTMAGFLSNAFGINVFWLVGILMTIVGLFIAWRLLEVSLGREV